MTEAIPSDTAWVSEHWLAHYEATMGHVVHKPFISVSVFTPSFVLTGDSPASCRGLSVADISRLNGISTGSGPVDFGLSWRFSDLHTVSR